MEDGVLNAKIDTREKKSYFINVINNSTNHKDENYIQHYRESALCMHVYIVIVGAF